MTGDQRPCKGASMPDWPTGISAAADEALALIVTVLVVIVSGGSPLFTGRWLYLGYPLVALYAVTAIGETYHRIRKYRFKRRVRRFEETQAEARTHDA